MGQTLLSLWGKKPGPVASDAPPVDSTPTTPAQAAPKPLIKSKQTFHVTLKLDPGKLAKIKPKVHPFFKQRKYTAPKQVTASTIVCAKWTQVPIPHAGLSATHEDVNLLQPLKKRSRLLVETDLYDMPKPPLTRVAQLRKARRHLVDTEPRTPFDFGRYERSMWCDKYAPKRLKQHVHPEQCRQVAQWIKNQFKNLKRARPEKPIKRRKFDPFVAPDDELDRFKPFLVVHGPSGSGKTAAVYSACGLFEALVLECNLTTKRTGAQLREMLNGVMESHVVHAQDDNKWYHCAILIDEADISLDQEQSFWPALKEFAYKTRRPIVFTCEKVDDMPVSVINNDTAEFVRMSRPDPVTVTEKCWKICTSEGYLVSKQELAQLVVLYKSDIRRVLVHLQFWLQMGVGGSLAGAEWFKKAHEKGRVVSANNYIEIPRTCDSAGLLSCALGPEPVELKELARLADQIAATDAFTTGVLDHDSIDATSALGLEISALNQSLLETATPYLRPHTSKYIDTHSFFGDPTDSELQLRTELLPILRDIARGDLLRAKASEGFRRSKRSLASFGLERQVLDDPRRVLGTFMVWEDNREASNVDPIHADTSQAAKLLP